MVVTDLSTSKVEAKDCSIVAVGALSGEIAAAGFTGFITKFTLFFIVNELVYF